MKALINNIQRFCLHDGPGIRTVVFFQGCPLRCRWCANPETQPNKPVLVYNSIECIDCGTCLQACGYGNIVHEAGKIRIDRARCSLCGNCSESCPTGALRLQGSEMDIDEILPILLRDRNYYEQSGGGVTLSGGEPCLQQKFSTELIGRLGENHIRTAVETCGYCDTTTFVTMAEACDLLLFDIKHTDPDKHLQGCGADHSLIVKNLETAVKLCEVHLRVPLIPGFNDDSDNLIQTARIADRLNIGRIDILPFHRLGAGKYRSLDMRYEYGNMPAVAGEYAEACAKLLRNHTKATVHIVL